MAGELVFGVGLVDIGENSATRAAGIVVEYHTDPFFTGLGGSFSWAGAMEADDNNDLFVGAGVYGIWRLWRMPLSIESSFAPGYYRQGEFGKNLGSILQFRSLLGLAYALNNSSSLAISIDHKSNGGFEGPNPGEETLALRYSIGF